MNRFYLYLIALEVVLLDQATKFLAASRLPFRSPVPALDGVLYFTYVHNPGGAFGLFQSSTWLLVLVTLAAVAAIIAFSYRRAAFSVTAGIALGLLLGGALGNVIDRLRLGYVVDFIDVRFWPVFNLADMAVTAGVLLLGYNLIFREEREHH